MLDSHALKGSLLKRNVQSMWIQQEQQQQHLLHHQHLCFLNLESAWLRYIHVTNYALLHWISGAYHWTVASVVYFKISVRLQWQIASLPIGVNDEDLPERAVCDWMQNIPVVFESWVLGCALYLGLGRVKHPQMSVLLRDCQCLMHVGFTCM